MEAKPDICVLQNVAFKEAELQDVTAVVGKDLFTDELRETLRQFEQAKNFGSLILPRLRDPAEALRVVNARDFDGDLLLKEVQQRVIAVLRMAEALSPQYHVVVANPPYMGSGGMNPEMTSFARVNFPDSRSDLYAMFTERCLSLNVVYGMSALVTIQNWMFISSFEKLRDKLISRYHISDLLQIGFNSFPELNSKVVQAVAFVIKNGKSKYPGRYINLNDAAQSANKREILELKLKENDVFLTEDEKFSSIPGSPIGYWLSDSVFKVFENLPSLASVAPTKQGLATGDNEQFLRQWYEVSSSEIGQGTLSSKETEDRPERWYPCNKGGEFRKWFGNNAIVVDWQHSGKRNKILQGQQWKASVQTSE